MVDTEVELQLEEKGIGMRLALPVIWQKTRLDLIILANRGG